MPISSMTGFARRQGQIDGCSWSWEVRSVNARGLDVRCRLPAGFESLEFAVRERIARRVRRGSVTAALTVQRNGGQGSVRINTDVLDQILAMLPDIRRRLPEAPPPTVEGLLALRGVIEASDDVADEEAQSALESALLADLDQVLVAMADVRAEEGGRLRTVLDNHLQRLAVLCEAAEQHAAMQPQALLDRLKTQIAQVLESGTPLPEERLAQEVALLVAKADLREELDRLKAHRESAGALVGEDKPVGRRLDFLCQELNREANTLCAKSSNMELTRIGVELKATIEQLREQVQNIE